MGDNSANLAALIGSRICHDLISPIGAITNGLELLDLAGGVQGPELDLIAESVGNAGARIRFFRIAYGAAGEQTLGRTEIVSVLEDIGRGGRLKVHWAPPDPQPRSQVRLCFLALQCIETAMPYGGTVEVQCEEGFWTLTGTASKLNIDEALWSVMTDPSAEPDVAFTPAQVQFALLPALVADQQRRITMTYDNDQITLRY